MAKVLVTGGTGTLGREVVSRLLDKHYSTRILSHKSKPSVPKGTEVYVGDLETGTGLRDATKDVDAIIHCASASDGSRGNLTILKDPPYRSGVVLLRNAASLNL